MLNLYQDTQTKASFFLGKMFNMEENPTCYGEGEGEEGGWDSILGDGSGCGLGACWSEEADEENPSFILFYCNGCYFGFGYGDNGD